MVIQSSLEDLYRRLLMKVLTDYQAKLKGEQTRKMAKNKKSIIFILFVKMAGEAQWAVR
jgi:hypothetical protein